MMKSALNLPQSALLLKPCVLSPTNSSYWSHAGLHATGWEESGPAAQLPPRFPQVSFYLPAVTACRVWPFSQMSRCIHIHVSAARLVADPQKHKPRNRFSALESIFLETHYTLQRIMTERAVHSHRMQISNTSVIRVWCLGVYDVWTALLRTHLHRLVQWWHDVQDCMKEYGVPQAMSAPSRRKKDLQRWDSF